jgi:hypothetical protein
MENVKKKFAAAQEELGVIAENFAESLEEEGKAAAKQEHDFVEDLKNKDAGGVVDAHNVTHTHPLGDAAAAHKHAEEINEDTLQAQNESISKCVDKSPSLS